MGKIYITRHGETEWNKIRKMQGHGDSPLSDLGKQQAAWLRDRVKHIPIKAIYSSPLGRAYKTAEILNQNWKLHIIKEPALAEIQLGNWQGKSMEEIVAMNPKEYDHFWNAPHLYSGGDGEDFLQVMNRVTDFFKMVIEIHKEEAIFLVAHAAVLKTLFCYLFHEGNLEVLWKHEHMHPASLTVLDYTKGILTIEKMVDTEHYKKENESPDWFSDIR